MTSTKERFFLLVRESGEKVGQKGLQPDSNGVIHWEVEGKRVLSFFCEPERNSLVVQGVVGEVEGGDEEAIYQKLLQANTFFRETRGYSLGLVTGTKQVVLAREYSMEVLTPDSICNLVEVFIQVAWVWRKKLRILLRGSFP